MLIRSGKQGHATSGMELLKRCCIVFAMQFLPHLISSFQSILKLNILFLYNTFSTVGRHTHFALVLPHSTF